MKGTVVITAAGQDLDSLDGEYFNLLRRAIEYYQPLGWPILVGVRLRGIYLAEVSSFFSEIRLEVVDVPENCQGALATAVFTLAAQRVDEGSLLIAAGDTFYTESAILDAITELVDSEGDAGTVVFESQDPRFSFVALDSNGIVQYVSEKQLVGRYATTGNFFFSDISGFTEAATWCFVNKATVNGSYFVSSALNYFLFRGKKVSYAVIDAGLVNKRWPSSASH